MNTGFSLKRINISANQMISGDGKSINSSHVWFGSITSSEKVVMDTAGFPIRNVWWVLIDCKYCARHSNEKILKYF